MTGRIEPHFVADKEGLRRIMERRGKSFAVAELLQNAWDSNASTVAVTLEPVAGAAKVVLTVEDNDPEGFKDLTHAFTLFAPSGKAGDAEKRGRFNLGEKLVVAVCERATITTTTGTVEFLPEGRKVSRSRCPVGSEFRGVLRMTRTELEETHHFLSRCIPPFPKTTTIDGMELARPAPLRRFTATLPTEMADENGFLRRRERKTEVEVHALKNSASGWLFEMGIPVQELGTPYDVNVLQKVPLNMERDGAPASYVRTVRTLVLDEMKLELTPAEVARPWAREATDNPNLSPETIRHVMDLRYGEKRVAYDPSDKEANARAVASGYHVVHGGSLTAGEWENVKKAGAIKPAGAVFPSPVPFHPDGKPLKTLPREQWTADIHSVVVRAKRFYTEVMGMDPHLSLSVTIADDPHWGFLATFGRHGQSPFEELTLNRGLLKDAWFGGPLDQVDELLIHEFAHHYESNHLSNKYHDACCMLGAKLASAVRAGRMP